MLEQQRRLDAQDRAGHRDRLAVGRPGEDHLAALAEVDGDVGVERQPPVGQPLGGGDGVPHVADVVGEVALEADDAAIGGAFEHAVVAGGEVVGHWDRSFGEIGSGGALEVALEGVEPPGQLGAVGLEPLVELPQRLGAQAVEAALGVAADLDEAGVAEHLEVAGHAGLVHADGVDELGHRPLAAPHRVEDPTASRLGDHVEDGELSGHGI